MLTPSRIKWFLIGFAFALPAAVVMFRDSNGPTPSALVGSLAIAVTSGILLAAFLGQGEA